MIVITDGKSNVGGNPVTAASEAAGEGIVVNAIGIVNHQRDEDDSLYEVEQIARAGGGIWQVQHDKRFRKNDVPVTQNRQPKHSCDCRRTA